MTTECLGCEYRLGYRFARRCCGSQVAQLDGMTCGELLPLEPRAIASMS